MKIKRKIHLLKDEEIEIEIDTENKADDYFDLEKFQTSWHDYKVGRYHLSSIQKCLRKYFLNFQYADVGQEFTTKELGIFYLGSLIHAEIQAHREKGDGFSIVERPIRDEFQAEDGGWIELVGKVDLLDILRMVLEDIKSQTFIPKNWETYNQDKLDSKYGKYILQTLGYTFFLNEGYFKDNPIETIKIVLVRKRDLWTTPISFQYNKYIGKIKYLTIRNRAKYLHKCIQGQTKPEAECKQYECKYCKYRNREECMEGVEFYSQFKSPQSLERNEFEKKYDGKRAYWKYDEKKGKWIKTKKFVEFLKEEKGYSDKKIKEML